MRRQVRDYASNGHLLERMVHDVRWLLIEDRVNEDQTEVNVLHLWDEKKDNVASGILYDLWEEGARQSEIEMGRVDEDAQQ